MSEDGDSTVLLSSFCQYSATVIGKQTKTNPQTKRSFASNCHLSFHWAPLKRFWLHLLYSSPREIHTQGWDSPNSSVLQNMKSQLSQPLLVCHMIQLLYPFCALLLDYFPICSCMSSTGEPRAGVRTVDTSKQCGAEWKDCIPWSVCSTLPNSAKDVVDLLCHKTTLLTDNRGLELHLPLLSNACQC